MIDVPINTHLLKNNFPFENEVTITGFLEFNSDFYQQQVQFIDDTNRISHIIFLIDTSYSMNEEDSNGISKIKQIVNILKTIVNDNLLDGMYISLVNYDEKASIIFNHLKIDDNKQLIISKINDLLHLGGMTYSGLGLEKIKDDIQLLKNNVSRVIMFTDGEDFDEFEALDQVKMLLRQGVTLSTIGVGEEYNDDFLISMADEGKGSFFHVQNMSSLLQEIQYDISNLKEEKLTNSSISLFHPRNVTPVEFYKIGKSGVIELRVENNEILCGNIIEGDKIFFRLKLNNIVKEGVYKILAGTIEYTVLDDQKKSEFSVKVKISKNPSKDDYPSQEVMDLNKFILLYKKAKLISELQNEGKEEEARRLFHEIKPLASAIGIDGEIGHILSEIENGKTITKDLTRTLLSFTRTKTITVTK